MYYKDLAVHNPPPTINRKYQMKLDITTRHWDTTSQAQTITVDDTGMSKMVSLISQNIYTKPSSAFREYWLNARESHQAAATAGKTPEPLSITLPMLGGDDVEDDCVTCNETTLINHKGSHNGGLFTIRDYGLGLSRDELANLVGSAGSSTKDTTDEYGGGMGIGSLSGFFVSDQIVFEAYQNGEKNTLVLNAADSSWALADSAPTDEPDGVNVSFVVKNPLVHEFVEGALVYLAANEFAEPAIVNMNLGELYTRGSISAFTDFAESINHYDIPVDSKMTVTNFSHHSLAVQPEMPPNTIMVRVDGCLYRGVLPGVFPDMTLKVIDKAQKMIHPDIDMILNERIIRRYVSTVKNRSVLGSGEFPHGSILADYGGLHNHYIVDVPVGFYAREIQPSRETIMLPDKDVENIAEAMAEAIVAEWLPAKDFLLEYLNVNPKTIEPDDMARLFGSMRKSFDSNPQAVSTVMKFLSDKATLPKSHSRTTTITSEKLYDCLQGGFESWGIRLNIDSGIIRGTYKHIGHVFTGNDDDTVDIYAIHTIMRETKVTHMPATVDMEHIGTFNPEDLLVVSTTNQKDNAKTLSDSPKVTSRVESGVLAHFVNGKRVLFATPYVDKLLKDPYLGSRFASVTHLPNADIIPGAAYKKLIGITRTTTPAKEVSYPVYLWKRNKPLDSFIYDDTRTPSHIARISANYDKVVVCDGSMENIARKINIETNKDNNIIFVVVTGNKSKDKAIERLVKNGTPQHKVSFEARTESTDIEKTAFAILTDTEKNSLRDCAIFMDMKHKRMFNNIDSWDDTKKILQAFSVDYICGTIKHVLDADGGVSGEKILTLHNSEAFKHLAGLIVYGMMTSGMLNNYGVQLVPEDVMRRIVSIDEALNLHALNSHSVDVSVSVINAYRKSTGV